MADDEVETWTLAAETKEWVGPITVLVDGVATGTFKVSISEQGKRPLLWRDPFNTGSVGSPKWGIVVGVDTDFPLSPGRKYAVWTKYEDTPEKPVDRVGFLRII